MEQLLGGAVGAWEGGGPHQFGRDMREGLSRRPKGFCCYWARRGQKGSLAARAEGQFVTEAISIDLGRLRV